MTVDSNQLDVLQLLQLLNDFCSITGGFMSFKSMSIRNFHSASLFPRRDVLATLFLPILVACASRTPKAEDPLARVAPLVKKPVVWKIQDFLDFLNGLPASGLLVLKKSIDLLPAEATEQGLKGTQVDVLEIATALCQKASWFRQCTKPGDFDYHGLVLGLAATAKVDPAKLKNANTFDAEQLLMEKVCAEVEKGFIAKWDRMSLEDRKKVIERVDPNGKIKDHALTASMAGGAVIRALQAAIGITGFSGYVAATTALSAVTAAVGLTLPFAVYTSLTKAIAVLTGPVGKSVGALLTLFEAAVAGRPDAQKTAGFVLTMHALKLDALKAVGADYSPA